MIKKFKAYLKKNSFIVKAYYVLLDLIKYNPIYLIVQKILRHKFIKDFEILKIQAKKTKERFILDWKDKKLYFHERTNETEFDRHYIFHTAWAARALEKIKPKTHTDIASSLYLAGIVSAFMPIKFYDYRPANLNLKNLTSDFANLLYLPFENESIESLSCLHVIEHVGLGRYGDPLDYNGDLKAINELKRVLCKGGNLLFAVPVGKPRIIFNVHRIYSYDQIIECFSDFELKEFALIPDKATNGGLIYNATKTLVDKQNYGCGCFWFIKSINKIK